MILLVRCICSMIATLRWIVGRSYVLTPDQPIPGCIIRPFEYTERRSIVLCCTSVERSRGLLMQELCKRVRCETFAPILPPNPVCHFAISGPLKAEDITSHDPVQEYSLFSDRLVAHSFLLLPLRSSAQRIAVQWRRVAPSAATDCYVALVMRSKFRPLWRNF